MERIGMTDQEAHEFLKLYVKFTLMVDGAVKITDVDPAIGDVEIEANGRRFWTDKWTAAKVISANSS